MILWTFVIKYVLTITIIKLRNGMVTISYQLLSNNSEVFPENFGRCWLHISDVPISAVNKNQSMYAKVDTIELRKKDGLLTNMLSVPKYITI